MYNIIFYGRNNHYFAINPIYLGLDQTYVQLIFSRFIMNLKLKYLNANIVMRYVFKFQKYITELKKFL